LSPPSKVKQTEQRQPDKFPGRIDLHPVTASLGVSEHPVRLTMSSLAMDHKRAIAALGALAQVIPCALRRQEEARVLEEEFHRRSGVFSRLKVERGVPL
jgi:hypothetical protein